MVYYSFNVDTTYEKSYTSPLFTSFLVYRKLSGNVPNLEQAK